MKPYDIHALLFLSLKQIIQRGHAEQLDIGDLDVKKVLIDNGSSMDIIFHHTLDRMILKENEKVRPPEPSQGPLFGFWNHAVPV